MIKQPQPQPFDLRIAGSDLVVHVPASSSALAALEKAGIRLRYSCRLGVCGACRTRVTAGIPLHRDDVLRPDEKASGGVFIPCCSRALSPVLEIDIGADAAKG